MLWDPVEKGSLSAVTARLEKTGLELLGAMFAITGGEGKEANREKQSQVVGKTRVPGTQFEHLDLLCLMPVPPPPPHSLHSCQACEFIF